MLLARSPLMQAFSFNSLNIVLAKYCARDATGDRVAAALSVSGLAGSGPVTGGRRRSEHPLIYNARLRVAVTPLLPLECSASGFRPLLKPARP